MTRNYSPLLKHPNVKAFLALIKHTEGADYDVLFGGEVFEGFEDHPRRKITRKLGGKMLTSTAAGAYQFLARTWDECAQALSLPDFSPESQDQGALFLIDRRRAMLDVLQGNWESAIAKCNKEWASLPGSPYGQPTKSMQKCLDFLEQQVPSVPDDIPVLTTPERFIVAPEHLPGKSVVTNVLDALEAGKELANATTWKKGQVLGSRLTVFLVAAIGIARAFGHDFGLTDEQMVTLGTAIAGLVGVLNEVATTVSTSRIGLRARGDALRDVGPDRTGYGEHARRDNDEDRAARRYSGDDDSLSVLRGRR